VVGKDNNQTNCRLNTRRRTLDGLLQLKNNAELADISAAHARLNMMARVSKFTQSSACLPA